MLRRLDLVEIAPYVEAEQVARLVPWPAGRRRNDTVEVQLDQVQANDEFIDDADEGEGPVRERVADRAIDH